MFDKDDDTFFSRNLEHRFRSIGSVALIEHDPGNRELLEGFELLQKPYSIEQLSRVLHHAGRRNLEEAPTPASS